MSKQAILLEFDKWDCDRLSLFLTENGLSDCCEVIKKMKITGREFLELTEIKLLAWRNFSPKFRKNALLTFIEDVKNNPEKYVKKKLIPKRTVSFEKLNDSVVRNETKKKNESITKLKNLDMLQKNDRADNTNSNKKTPKAVSSKNVTGGKTDYRTVNSKIDSDRPKIGSGDSVNNKVNSISRNLNKTNSDSSKTNRNPYTVNTNVTKDLNTNKLNQNISNRSKNNSRFQAETKIKYNQRSKETFSGEWAAAAVGTRSNQSPPNKSNQSIINTKKDNARMQIKTQIKYNQKSKHSSSDESEEETNKLPEQCPLNKSFLHNIPSVLDALSKKLPPSVKVQIPKKLHKDTKSQVPSRMNNSIETEDDEEVEDIYEALSDEENFEEPIYENLSRRNNSDSGEEEWDEPVYENPSHKNSSESEEDDQPIYEDPSWKENEPSRMRHQNASSIPPPLPPKLNFETNTRNTSQDVKSSNADCGLPITKMKKMFTWGKRNKNDNSSAELINKSETIRITINQPTEKDSGRMKLNPFSGRKSSLPVINNQTRKLPEPPTSIPKLNLLTFDSDTSLSSSFSEESLNQECNRKMSAPSLLSLPGSAPKQAPIEQHNAFHNIDRAEATRVLKTLPDGNYLFRPSSKEGNACVLSVVCRGIVYHLAVLSQEDGRLSFGSDEDFEDLRAIVHFYKKQSLKLIYDGDAIGTVSLTKYVSATKK